MVCSGSRRLWLYLRGDFLLLYRHVELEFYENPDLSLASLMEDRRLFLMKSSISIHKPQSPTGLCLLVYLYHTIHCLLPIVAYVSDVAA